MTLTFELVVGFSPASFTETINDRLSHGWKFMNGMTVDVSVRKDIGGHDTLQYSIAMILEEEGEKTS